MTEAFVSAHLHYVPWCGWVHLEDWGTCVSTSALCPMVWLGASWALVNRCCLLVPHTGVLFCHCRALGCRSPVTSRISCSLHCMQSCQWSTLLYYQQVVGSVYKLRLTCLFFLCLPTHKNVLAIQNRAASLFHSFGLTWWIFHVVFFKYSYLTKLKNLGW